MMNKHDKTNCCKCERAQLWKELKILADFLKEFNLNQLLDKWLTHSKTYDKKRYYHG